MYFIKARCYRSTCFLLNRKCKGTLLEMKLAISNLFQNYMIIRLNNTVDHCLISSWFKRISHLVTMILRSCFISLYNVNLIISRTELTEITKFVDLLLSLPIAQKHNHCNSLKTYIYLFYLTFFFTKNKTRSDTWLPKLSTGWQGS